MIRTSESTTTGGAMRIANLLSTAANGYGTVTLPVIESVAVQ
jgi:hypothetical protein